MERVLDPIKTLLAFVNLASECRIISAKALREPEAVLIPSPFEVLIRFTFSAAIVGSPYDNELCGLVSEKIGTVVLKLPKQTAALDRSI